jgi:hypothetical protein
MIKSIKILSVRHVEKTPEKKLPWYRRLFKKQVERYFFSLHVEIDIHNYLYYGDHLIDENNNMWRVLYCGGSNFVQLISIMPMKELQLFECIILYCTAVTSPQPPRS